MLPLLLCTTVAHVTVDVDDVYLVPDTRIDELRPSVADQTACQRKENECLVDHVPRYFFLFEDTVTYYEFTTYFEPGTATMSWLLINHTLPLL